VAQTANGFALRAAVMAGSMFGWGAPPAAGSQISGHGTFVPLDGGASLSYQLGNGFTLLAAVSIVSDAFANLTIDPTLAGGLAFRYDLPQSGLSFQPFVLAGITATPSFTAHISRTYSNGAGTATGVGTAAGTFASVFVRGGATLHPTTEDSLELTASLIHGRLGVAAYTEASGAGNPFPASFAAQTQSSTTVIVGAAWTRALTPDLSLTMSAEAGHIFGTPAVTGTVPGAGTLTGTGQGVSFGGLEATIGWRISDLLSADAAVGAMLTEGFGPSAHIGGGLHLHM
jgi:hypothetical protein